MFFHKFCDLRNYRSSKLLQNEKVVGIECSLVKEPHRKHLLDISVKFRAALVGGIVIEAVFCVAL